ncbi:MAG: hypothetical protein K0S32_3373 [Bacteroidetes bacterium]|jgi:hypothetical protein|nr:hypothetical protein [Bacteroidota bacterium]
MDSAPHLNAKEAKNSQWTQFIYLLLCSCDTFAPLRLDIPIVVFRQNLTTN